MDNITLENFISFCDDMQIANEGFKEGTGIFDKIINTLQRGVVWFNKAIVKLKEKMSKGKYVIIPKSIHASLTECTRNIFKFYNYDVTRLDDLNLDAIKKDIDDTIADANKHRNDKTDTISGIPLEEVYQNMRMSLKNITNGIKFAESLKPKLKNDPDGIRKDYIHKLSNEVDLMYLLMKIDRCYLSFPVSTTKNVNISENPESQIVTKEERDKGMKMK